MGITQIFLAQIFPWLFFTISYAIKHRNKAAFNYRKNRIERHCIKQSQFQAGFNVEMFTLWLVIITVLKITGTG